MPGWLTRTALIAYGILCLAFQLRLSMDWLVREGQESARARRPFSIRLFEPDGGVDIPFPESREAGLLKGDRLTQVDGEPYNGAGGYFRALDRHRGGDTLHMRVQRGNEPTEREINIVLRRSAPEGGSWGPQDLIQLGVVQMLTPLTALGLGLLVLFRRPNATLSRIVFAFLLSFSILSTGGVSYEPIRMVCQWEPGLRTWALGHMAFWLYTWPAWLVIFSIYFPYRADWDIRRPWVARLLLLPAFLYGIVRSLALPAGVEALSSYRGLVSFADSLLQSNRVFTNFAAICILATFLESMRKLRAARDSDTRRRLRILLVASLLAWTPFLIAVFAQDIFGIRTRGWAFTASVALLLVFPATLVYLILVDRAMDIGVTIREGLQYAVARRGLFAAQFLVVLGLIVGLSFSLGDPNLRPPERMRQVALGFTAAFLSRRLMEKGGRWVDRRFFREQYQAGQLLTELAQQAGETADRSRLRELVTSRISSTLHTSTVHLIDQNTAEFAGTLSRLSQDRKPQWLDWRRPSEWMDGLEPHESTRLNELGAELILPVARQERLLGFLALGPRRSEQPYATSDVAVLESVASQTALALDNARLAETIAKESASREILAHELQIARGVQERLLPRTAPAIPGLDVAGFCVPAREVGGDLFDYIPLPDGQWAVAVGDVAGKGVSAALIMASLQSAVRGLAADGVESLPELMTRLNRLTYDSTPNNRFATFQIGVYDPASRRLRFCGAGHNPAVLVPAGSGEVQWLRPKGMALGLTREAIYGEMDLTLAPGDLLVFYTDGVTEAMNPDGELFGENRLAEWAQSAPAAFSDSKAMTRDLAARVAAFAGDAPQHDDITIIVIR